MTSLSSARISELEDTMKRCYPVTDWVKNLETWDTETICVPQCIDVLKQTSYRGLVEEARQGDRQNITGIQAEAAFLYRFTELKLGGILIAGLRTTDLEKTGRKQKGENVLEDGDWDALFIHRKRGIFVVEVKGAGQEVLGDQQMAKAKKQLDKQTENIRQLYYKFFRQDCPTVTGIICFPFRRFSNEDKHYGGYDVIDSSIIYSKFKRLFERRTQLSVVQDVFIERFAAELICCRSEVLFHSQAYNAMQVAQWIQTQDYQSKIQKQQAGTERKAAPFTGTEGNFGRIILTAQQLEIVHCPDRCITIRGAPGSGKTLIAMIRALTAAKQRRSGRVLVFVNEALIAKYERYFDEAKDREYIVREPIVHSTDRMTEALENDDVFFDETPLRVADIKEIKKRASATGKTTVVFTGFDNPGRADADFRLYENELSGYNRHFTLNTVLRGTKEIFNEWQKYFHRGTKIGHTITGVSVDRHIFNSLESVQQELLKKVLELLKDPVNKNSGEVNFVKLTPIHLSVITSHTDDAEKLRRFFIANKILNGTVKEQVLDTKPLMAVDTFDRTPSYEWPVVFIVHRIGDPKITQEAVFSMAASRCIASLTIIEFENNTGRMAGGFSGLGMNERSINRAEIDSLPAVNIKKAQPAGTQMDTQSIPIEPSFKSHLEFFQALNSPKVNAAVANLQAKSKPATNIPQKNEPQPIVKRQSQVQQQQQQVQQQQRQPQFQQPQRQPQVQQQQQRVASGPKPKSWIRLQIGAADYQTQFFAQFVSAANAAGYNLQATHSLSLEFYDADEAVQYMSEISGICTIDYIIALDNSGFTKNVQARACNILINAFPQKPQPYTVFKAVAIKCLPGYPDYDWNMGKLVDTVFRHFSKRGSSCELNFVTNYH